MAKAPAIGAGGPRAAPAAGLGSAAQPIGIVVLLGERDKINGCTRADHTV
jgi:hypothetical protein